MPKREPKDRPDDPPQPQPAEKTKEPSSESLDGIPPGVSFDTEEGRRAHGGDEDFNRKKANESAKDSDDEDTELAD